MVHMSSGRCHMLIEIASRLFRRSAAFACSAALSLTLLAGTARTALGQPEKPAADPIAVEQMNAQMEDAMEDMAFSMDPAGMTSGEGMFGAFFGPSVTKADFTSFLKLLAFDKEQSDAASMIYRQRFENYETKAKPMQEMITKIMKQAMQAGMRGEQFEPENMEEIVKTANEIQKERSTMTKGVLDDLRSLVNKDQESAWPKVELAERRNRLFRFQPLMMIPGARVDLRVVLDKMRDAIKASGGEQPDANVQAAIDQAVSVCDSALDEQAKAAIPLDDTMRSSMIVAKPTPEQMEQQMKIFREGSEIGSKVRASIETANKSIISALGGSPAAKEAFQDAFNAAAYPQIYRTLHAQNVLAAALKLSDVSEEQRAKLRTMQSEFEAKLKELRPKAVMQLTAQTAFSTEMMAAKDDEARTKAMEKFQEAMKDNSRQQIKDADKDIVKRVREMLTDEQRDKLPKRPKVSTPFEIQPAEPEGTK